MKRHKKFNSLVALFVFVLLHLSPCTYAERGDDYYRATTSNKQLLELAEICK